MSSPLKRLSSRKFLRRGLKAVGVTALFLICLNCGEEYRPVANPIIPNPPNTAFTHIVLMISDNGASNPGASTTYDVSGDSASSQSQTGLGPVYAAVVGGTQAYVANSLEDTISEFSVATPAPVVTISLPSSCGTPPCSMPVFVGTSETSTVYVANAKSNTVAAISTSNNAVSNNIIVGNTPVALAETPDAQKVYVANAGTNGSGGSVSVINTVDKSVVANPPLAAFGWVSPVWVLARSDSERIYVLDQGSGLLAAVDTSADAVVGSVSVGVGANYMIYDSHLNRIYVVNPASDTVICVQVASDALTTNTIAVANPESVTALADGSRFYVSTGAIAGGNVTPAVSVFNASNFALRVTVALPAVPSSCTVKNWAEFALAAAADSTRVYLGNCDAGSTAIIETSNDKLVVQMAAPFSSQPPSQPGGTPPPQNPVFVLAGP